MSKKIKKFLFTWHSMSGVFKYVFKSSKGDRCSKYDAICSLFYSIQLWDVGGCYKDWVVLIFKLHFNSCWLSKYENRTVNIW